MRGCLLVLCGACSAAMIRPEPARTAGIEVRYSGGVPILQSHKATADVAVMPLTTGSGRYEDASRVGYVVTIANRSAATFDVGEASISATVNDRAVRVLTAAEMEDEVRSEAQSARIRSAVGAFLQTAGAGSEAMRDHYAHDAEVRRADIDAAESGARTALARVLQRTTLDPGGATGCVIYIDPERGSACVETKQATSGAMPHLESVRVPCRIVLRISTGADVHEFAFDEIETR